MTDRLPIMAETHDSECELPCVTKKSISSVCKHAQRAQVKNTGYIAGYYSKRQPVGKFEVSKCIEGLDAIGELPDPQVALALPRSCALFGKMVFSARTTPFDIHQEQLLCFDNAVWT